MRAMPPGGVAVRFRAARARNRVPAALAGREGERALVEMKVLSVGMVQGSDGNVVVLKEADGDRLLVIAVGLAEASAIALQLQGLQPPGP